MMEWERIKKLEDSYTYLERRLTTLEDNFNKLIDYVKELSETIISTDSVSDKS